MGQIDVLDAEIEGVSDPETAGIKQMNNEPGGVTMHVRDAGKQLKAPRLGTGSHGRWRDV